MIRMLKDCCVDYLRSFGLSLLFIVAFGFQGKAQTSNVEFGKNRVQFHRFFEEWQQYESEHFITYWYGPARKVAESASMLAEADYDLLQTLIEYRPNKKLHIIVFTDLTDLKQTNIGDDEVFTNTGGITKIVDNKIFVYFNGDHVHLRKQIRQGLTKLYLQAMSVGSSFQELVQSALSGDAPNWYVEGFSDYMAEEWNTELDNWLRQYILDPEYDSFEELLQHYPRQGGHALWFYMGKTYGKSNLSNLIYLTRFNSSIDAGLRYAIGVSESNVMKNAMIFYKEWYRVDQNVASPTAPERNLKLKKRTPPVTDIALSPNGRYATYITNEIGKCKLWLHDLETDKRKVIFRYGIRNPFQATDFDYPIMAWSPNSQQLSIVYERKDIIKLRQLNISQDGKRDCIETDWAPDFQRIHDIDYVDGSTLVFSATVSGISDIFLYYPSKRQAERITNDFWDDLDVKSVNIHGQKGVIFSSNRPDSILRQLPLDTILPTNAFDLFYYNLSMGDVGNHALGKELTRITHTPQANERQAFAIDSMYYGFLTDENGILNQSVGYLHDTIVYYEQVVTFRDSSIMRFPIDTIFENIDSSKVLSITQEPVIKPMAFNHTITNELYGYEKVSTSSKNEILTLRTHHGKPVIAFDTLTSLVGPKRNKYSGFLRYVTHQASALGEEDISNVLNATTTEDENDGNLDYTFESPFGEMPVQDPIALDKPKTFLGSDYSPFAFGQVPDKDIQAFRRSRITNYNVRFRSDFLTSQIDNGQLYEGLNSYAGTPAETNTMPMGVLFKMKAKDVFEDYIIEGGIRIPLAFNGKELFLQYSDKKFRLDKQFGVYYRKNSFSLEPISAAPQRAAAFTTLFSARFSYPLDIFQSIRVTGTFRMDKTVRYATDINSINIPNITQQRLGLKTEYIYDNAYQRSINLWRGTRFKAYGEIVKRFDININNGLSVDVGQGYMTILGVDARHYLQLDKHSILAVRAAGATTFGAEKIEHILGGVDNWIFSSQENNPIIQYDSTFAYRATATNLRGFRQNIRNGNSYALINSELRMPIFRYFSPRPLTRSFWRDFQLVGFFDIGTAWVGKDPFVRNNPQNTVTIGQPPVTVTVSYFRDPIIFGYGFGARFNLFGYFMRLDWAKGWETKVWQDPVVYFAIGTDF